MLSCEVRRQFQCRQCQDLLENNIAHKRPIEGIVARGSLVFTEFCLASDSTRWKKNLEVHPMAINKGEIVKRILYLNPDAQFVFCAGDDKVHLTCAINSFV